ncbi:hypothetical protein [Undibacterium crateris]|uniref:hypothetical protein n=1 Tax=Undibacterium crateris TaxID=2528175 RepID=UPI00138A15AD|nr:hypothetical protein [Undibacterium crateris]NDI84363.1 hypothetical protein [Undibacterium crateris]
MNTHHLLAIVLAALLHLPMAAHAEEVGILHLRPLHLQLPPTWQFDGKKNPIEGYGPNGEKVLITIMRRKNESVPLFTEIAKGFAESQMKKLGEKGNLSISRPLAQLPTPTGKIGFSVASEGTSPLGGNLYFIQYLLAGESALFYLTVEGRGDVAPIVEQFNSYIATHVWDN